jgi:hypothetical protein
MVAHGGTSVAGSFIQTLTMVDVATGWTECLPLVTRDGSLVVEAMKHARSLFPWLLRGVDFDNDSPFMNDVQLSTFCLTLRRCGGPICFGRLWFSHLRVFITLFGKHDCGMRPHRRIQLWVLF